MHKLLRELPRNILEIVQHQLTDDDVAGYSNVIAAVDELAAAQEAHEARRDEMNAIETQLKSVESSIAAERIEAIEGTTDDDDRNAQDERRNLQRRRDLLTRYLERSTGRQVDVGLKLESARWAAKISLAKQRSQWPRARTLTKAEVQSLVDAYEIDSLIGLMISGGRGFIQKEIHLLVATDRLRAAAASTVPAMTKAEAKALMAAHEIEPLLLDKEEDYKLLENNPTLFGAYMTLGLIAEHGKP